jgi:hypothetical protein
MVHFLSALIFLNTDWQERPLELNSSGLCHIVGSGQSSQLLSDATAGMLSFLQQLKAAV